MKFNVYGEVKVFVTVEVEAEDADDAIDKAHDAFGGLTSYVGNGGYGKLVGTSERNVTLDPGEEVEFTDAAPI